MDQTSSVKIPELRLKENSISFKCFITLLTLTFFIAAPIAASLTGIDGATFIANYFAILTGPSRLVTDYFTVGCLASTLFNAGLCGLVCVLIILFSRAHANSTTFAAYILVIAHCFYGLNFINMWPPFFGVLIYCLVNKCPIRDNLHIAMFSTALAPFISDFLFFYPPGRTLLLGKFSVLGILLSLIFGLIAGFLVPALLPGTSKMNRGYNMYKSGLAIGMLGIFVYCLLYKTFGIEPHHALPGTDESRQSFGYLHYYFMNAFFAVIFTFSILAGFIMNGKSFQNYKKLLSCSGYGLDFADKFGMPLCFINFGIYGFCILIYLNIIFVFSHFMPFLSEGVGFTGATVGVTLAALTFSADGQHPKNVSSVALGYTILFTIICSICLVAGVDVPWTLATQSYINGLAFATGLCPIAGSYGFRYGVLAGLVSAIICTSTASMHGGFVLYNGGFNAGLTALIFIPILDFYKIKPQKVDSDEIFEIKGHEKSKFARIVAHSLEKDKRSNR